MNNMNEEVIYTAFTRHKRKKRKREMDKSSFNMLKLKVPMEHPHRDVQKAAGLIGLGLIRGLG